MNVVFIERIFPLYRKAVYDALYKKTGLQFFHTVNETSGIKQTTANYSSPIRFLQYGSKDSQVVLFTLRKLLRQKPQVVVHEFSAGILSVPMLLLFCRLRRIKLIFWGHMYDRTKGFLPQERMLDKYRLRLWKKADGLIVYSEAEKKVLTDYDILPEKVFVAFNTVDTDSYLKIRDELESIGKDACKKRIGFTYQHNLIFIGRLYKEKRPELLLDLLIGLKEKGFNSVAVHYVGNGEMMAQLETKRQELGLVNDVFFHGAVYDEKKNGELLFCSDLMVMPGCVGLSVNHAFCFNCPVVTFKEVNLDPAHGPEIEYVIQGKTGFVIQDHSTENLINAVADYLATPDLQMSMKEEVRNFIETKCSVETMASGVVKAIEYTVAKN